MYNATSGHRLWDFKAYLQLDHLLIYLPSVCDVKHISTFALKCDQGIHNVKCSRTLVDSHKKCCNGIWIPCDANLHSSKRKWDGECVGAGLKNSHHRTLSLVFSVTGWMVWHDSTKCLRVKQKYLKKLLVSQSRYSRYTFVILYPAYRPADNHWAASQWTMSQEYYYWQSLCHQIRATVWSSKGLWHVVWQAYILALMSNKKRLFACAVFFPIAATRSKCLAKSSLHAGFVILASSALIWEMSKTLLELVCVRNIWWPEDFQENQ